MFVWKRTSSMSKRECLAGTGRELQGDATQEPSPIGIARLWRSTLNPNQGQTQGFFACLSPRKQLECQGMKHTRIREKSQSRQNLQRELFY
jgi:hypothetical protein